MNFKASLKHNLRSVLCSLLVVAIAVTFMSALSFAVTTSDNILVDLGLGGCDELFQSEMQLNSWLTDVILGLTDDEVVAQYYDTYYDCLVNDYWHNAGGSVSIFDSSTNNFSDDYLSLYYYEYMGYYVVPPFNWDEFVLYAKARRAAELVESGSFDAGSYFKSNPQEDIKISSEGFKAAVEYVETFYSPSGDLDRLSWKNDSRWSELEKDSTKLTYRDLRITLMRNYKFNDKWYCIYLLPYYFDGTSYYYSTDLLYLYFESDVVGEAALYYKIYDTVTGNVTDPVKLADCFTSFYADIGPYFTGLNGGYWVNGSYILLRHSKDSESFNTANMTSHYASSGSTYGTCSLQSGFTDFWKMLKSDDGVTSINFANGTSYSQYFYQVLSNSTEKDYGFVCSDTFFFPELGGYTDIDSEKIPSNTTVTITGDTIGDYIYYDNKTGDTSTINEYITNNYTYITNNGSGTGESSGDDSGSSSGSGDDSGSSSGSGDVNVSGNVSVGGQIDINTKPIDINVNVSGSSGSGVDFDSPTLDALPDGQEGLGDLINYYDESADQIGGLFASFYQILPPAIANLIPLAVALIIFIGLVKVLH